ncbi:MAG: GAF domain-containing protein [Anaerolineae bacterium]|nr:GAF domain-containing protein [Anaerolineae bacterium]
MNSPSLQLSAYTQKELDEIKEKFNQLTQTSFPGILMHKKVRILHADPALAAMFGYTTAELEGMTVLELSTPEGREIVLKNTLLKHEKPYQLLGLKKDGAISPIEIFGRVLTYQGHIISVIAIREATGYEPAEILAALQKTKEELNTSLTGGRTTQLRFSNEQLRLELDERAQMEAELRVRARQQAAVAELGQRALVGTPLPALMDEAVLLAAQTLAVEHVKIQELLPDKNILLVRAGVGWKKSFPDETTMMVNINSQAGYTLLSGGPVIVENLDEETRFKPSALLLEHQVISGMSVIIYGHDEPFGVLGAHTTRPHTFTEDDIHFLQAIANVLAASIENTRLLAETKRRAEQLAVLHELDRAITTSLRLSDIYYAFAQHAIRLLAYDCMSIALLEDDHLRVVYVTDKKDRSPILAEGNTLPRQGSAMGWVTAEGQPLLRHNVAADPRFAEDELLLAHNIQSSMIVPLRFKGQVIGTWNIGAQKIDAYSPEDLEIAQSMADQLAIVIENARLFQQAKQEIAERQRAEAALEEERALLAQRVAERTMDLQVANEELARAARLKDEFLAGMSHELRTPLTAVLGMAEILKVGVYGQLTERQTKAINNIDESGHHLLALINDILDLSKIEANKLDLEIKPVSVEAVCQSSLQFIKQNAHKKSIKVSYTLDKAVAVLPVDQLRLKQILVNLLSNAVKFTPPGGKIGLEVEGDATRQWVHFTVWDTGIGISRADLPRLFEPFVQLDSKLSRQYSGTGLGLALVSRMAKMHGGKVKVESEVGQGSRFTVTLPWSEPLKTVTADEAPPATDNAVIQVDLPAPTKAQNPLILLAEDEAATASLLTDYLQTNGYRLITAQNGLEVLAQAKQNKPALILMDIQMPEMDGLEAIHHLRADAELSTIPVIALTALAMPGDRERCLAAGANDYFSKPVKLKQLVAAIETQIKPGTAPPQG